MKVHKRLIAGAIGAVSLALLPVAAFANTTALSDYQTNTLPTIGQIAVNVINAFSSGLSTMATTANSQLSGPLVAFAGAAMGLWTTFELFKMLSVTHAVSPTQAIDTIVNKLLLFVILSGIVGSQVSTVASSYVAPTFSGILATGASLTQTVMSSSGAGASCTGSVAGGTDAISTAISSGASTYICQLDSVLGEGLGVGVYLMANSPMMAPPFINLVTFITGLIIACIFIYLMVSSLIICLDALFQFSITVILLPVIIMSYLFKSTRHMFLVGVKSVITSALSLVFSLLGATITVGAMKNACLDTIYGASSSAAAQAGTDSSAPQGVTSVTMSIVSTVVSGLTQAADTATTIIFGPISIVDAVTLLIYAFCCAAAIKLGPAIAGELVDFRPAALNGSGVGTAIGGFSGGVASKLGTVAGAGLGSYAGARGAASGASLGTKSAARAGDASMGSGDGPSGGGSSPSSASPAAAGSAAFKPGFENSTTPLSPSPSQPAADSRSEAARAAMKKSLSGSVGDIATGAGEAQDAFGGGAGGDVGDNTPSEQVDIRDTKR